MNNYFEVFQQLLLKYILGTVHMKLVYKYRACMLSKLANCLFSSSTLYMSKYMCIVSLNSANDVFYQTPSTLCTVNHGSPFQFSTFPDQQLIKCIQVFAKICFNWVKTQPSALTCAIPFFYEELDDKICGSQIWLLYF